MIFVVGGLYYPLLNVVHYIPFLKDSGVTPPLRRLKRLGLVGIPKAEKVEVDEKVGQMEAVLKRRWVGDRLGWVGRVEEMHPFKGW